MTPHGPDAATFEAAVGDTGQQQAPAHLPPDTLAFMFEVNYTPRVTMSVRFLSYHVLTALICYVGHMPRRLIGNRTFLRVQGRSQGRMRLPWLISVAAAGSSRDMAQPVNQPQGALQ